MPKLSVLASLCIFAASPVLAQRPLKVYISADMEGITGVASVDQLSPASFEYNQARQWMTAEVLAAIQGAREAGATEFVVSDSHGNGESLLIDRFPADVPITIVRSFPRPLGMMEGIDSTFGAVIFIGYHAATTSTTGVRAHTMSSALLTRIALNGVAQSEAGINAAIAAQYGVPVVMITGDDAIVTETKQRLGNLEGVIVKRAIGFHSAATLTPEVGQARIRQQAKTAVMRRAEMKPYTMTRPLTVEVSFKNYRPVELLGYLPNIQRIDAHTVRFAGRDMVEISKFLEFVTSYDPTLTP
ncbi:MAG TPA: M55 family metallopeptidase [Gemmatimonadaceae bacterium]|jgi:D-amino peptidase|nr:M55 family metallopeptidase [Gemmatimonadaceae bacterium]